MDSSYPVTFEEFEKKFLPPMEDLDMLPSPYRENDHFRKCYSKMLTLVRKGYKPKNIFVHFYNLHLWPLGLILMYPGPNDRIEENMMKKNLKRKHGSSTSGTDSTTASDSEA